MQSRPVERQRVQGTWVRASQRIFCFLHHRHALKKRIGIFPGGKYSSDPLSLMALTTGMQLGAEILGIVGCGVSQPGSFS